MDSRLLITSILCSLNKTQVYAPWCGHCQALEPMYNKLAKHLKTIDSLVIAKMDGTTNEHPKAKVIKLMRIKYTSLHAEKLSMFKASRMRTFLCSKPQELVFLVLQAEGFPTILFFPAGNKTSEPVSSASPGCNGFFFLNSSKTENLSSFVVCGADNGRYRPHCGCILQVPKETRNNPVQTGETCINRIT